MYLMRQRQKSADVEIEKIRLQADAEKEALVNSLKAMYHQLTKLNALEEQAVEAAKNRGGAHLNTLMTTAKALNRLVRGTR